jgi:type II secretory pathway pseudopilin PulG
MNARRAAGRWIAVSVVLLLLLIIGAIDRGRYGGERSIRAKVSRARANMITLSTAIETYRLDHGAYPPWTSDPSLQAPFHSTGDEPTFRRIESEGFARFYESLLAPIDAHSDPYDDADEPGGFAYWSASDEGPWILISRGPDGDFDLNLDVVRRALEGSPPRIEDLSGFTYDPTNGIASSGDVWRTSN